ncbi:MAG: MSMEG_4193 family putative phosphomutase [Nocardioidaceae bacterium]
MATVILVRHGRSTSNSDGVLAGRTPGIALDETGEQQAKAVAERVAAVPVAALVSSPLQRCRETAQAISAQLKNSVAVHADDRLTECGYGDWTGQPLKTLAKDKLWKVVQAHPSGATFPNGESLSHMQARGVAAVREWDSKVTAEHGARAIWVAVSHGDLIKSLLADALGMHLDTFQRIVVDPASVSVVSYTPLRPFVLRLNDQTDLSSLAPKRGRRRKKAASSDAPVGGGAG